MVSIFPLAILIGLILGTFGILGLTDKENPPIPPKVPEQSASGETSVIPGVGGGPGDVLPESDAGESASEPEGFKPFVGRYTSALNAEKVVVLEIKADQTATLTQNSPQRVIEKGVWAASREGILVVGLIEKDGEEYPEPIYIAFIPQQEEIVLYNLNEGQSSNQGLRLKKQQTALLYPLKL
jgi:hypothetical protein